MVANYKQIKTNILQQYQSFNDLLNSIRDIGISIKGSSLISLENQAENIRNDKFILVVAGEAKSGKSSFINAYLGEEILPVGTKSCTSAIIEIRYGKKFILKTTYADGRTDSFEDEKIIKEFLEKNAAFDDKYREIPVPIINMEILIKKRGKLPLDSEISDLMKEITTENICKLSSDEYEKAVRQYISEKTPYWMNIVKKIEIEYPFEDEDLKGIEIVDTPGVNAEGMVGDITHSYIEKANAVMFLKPLTGSSLAATSFKRFYEGKSADRNRDAIFLILTRRANETDDNRSEILNQAYEQFPDINKSQIICLDSKVELFYNRIKDMTAEELSQYMTPLVDERKLDSFLETLWYRAKFRRDSYLEQLKELSNFDVIDESLNKFARKASYIAFRDLLERMIKVLDAIEGRLGEVISNYQKKAADPLKLEIELARKKDALEELKLKINKTANEIRSQYTDSGGLIEKKAEEVSCEYERDISNLDESSIDSMEELQKITFRQVDKFIKYQTELEKEITMKCDVELISISEKNDIPFATLEPNITPETIESIKNAQANHAFVNQVTNGGCFKKAKTVPIFSQQRYFRLVRDNIEGQLQETKSNFISLLHDFVIEVLEVYRSELVINAETIRDEYDKVLNDKAEAEELKEKIEILKNVMDRIVPVKREIEAIKKGVDMHV